MKVRFSRRARTDVDQIWQYIAPRNLEAADKIVGAIESLSGRLSDHPHLGRRIGKGDVRLAPLPRIPYLVFYEVSRGEVNILRVIHGARQWPETL
jgi:toxin ParE1/3/4